MKIDRAKLDVFIKEKMVKNIDYGWTDQRAQENELLKKPGSEKLCAEYGLRMAFEIDKDTYETVAPALKEVGTTCYKCILLNIGSGEIVGEGRGAASIDEKKNYTMNMVVKIACKRAQIDACLRVFSLSDRWTQDLDDLPKNYNSPSLPSQNAPKPKEAGQPHAETEKTPEKRTLPPPNKPQKSYKGFKVAWKDGKAVYVPSHLRGTKTKGGCSEGQVNFLDNLWRQENVDMGRILQENNVSTIAELPYEIGKGWIDQLKGKTYPKDYIISDTEDDDLGINENPLQPEGEKPKGKTPEFPKVDTKNPAWTSANGRLRAIVAKVFETDDDHFYQKFTPDGCSVDQMTAGAINALATEINDGMWTKAGKYIGPSYEE